MNFIPGIRMHMPNYASIGLVSALAFILFPGKVLANSLAPATFTFLSDPPERLIPIMVGVSILIVLIEAWFLWKMLGVGFRRAIWISFIANLISSIFGLAIMALPILVIPVCIGMLISWRIYRSEMTQSINIVIILSMLAFPLLLLLSMGGGYSGFQIFLGLWIPVSTFIAFGLSVIVEGITVKKFLKRSNIWTPVFIGNIVTYILLIAITASSYVPADGRRFAWMSRAKGTLRSIGSSQLAYQESNDGQLYGSFEALKQTLYIAEGYTGDNMIESYSLSWMVNSTSTAPSEQFPDGLMSTFTVIAFPNDTRQGYLSTFAINTDQEVRVFNPKNGNRFESIETWDPIL